MDAVLFGGALLVFGTIGYGAYRVRRWLMPRGHERQPKHISETPAGAKRHADRMAGLRALAEGIDEELPAEPRSEQRAEESAEGEEAARTEGGEKW